MTEFDWSLDTIGPMGRTVLDCAWLLEVIAGHDPSDITTSRRPVPHYEAFLTGDIAGIRVGVVKELLYHEEIHPEMRDAVLAAVKALNDQGAKVEEVSLPNIQYVGIASGVADQVNNVNLHLARFREHPELYDYATRTRFLTAALMPASAVSVAYRLRNLIRRDVLDLLSKFDVLVYPGAAGPAPKITPPSKSTNKDNVLNQMLNSPNLTSASNLVGVPSIVLPCGFSSTGLPLGLQITGGMFQEATVFRVAHAYQAVTNWHLRVAEL
jgi:aspartyl-tRNA(Asn)/glutamyl-tRNA(Gln) amidotransferase subunit A